MVAENENVHIDRTFLVQHIARLCRFVIESDIDTEVFEELDLFFGAGASDDLETVLFCELDD